MSGLGAPKRTLISRCHHSLRREIIALFCDLRGFTGFTESADAEDVVALLRDYHAAIGEIIIKYNGTPERYAGDGVIVVFNDPVPVEIIFSRSWCRRFDQAAGASASAPKIKAPQ